MPTAVSLGTAKCHSMRNCQKVLRPIVSSQSEHKSCSFEYEKDQEMEKKFHTLVDAHS